MPLTGTPRSEFRFIKETSCDLACHSRVMRKVGKHSICKQGIAQMSPLWGSDHGLLDCARELPDLTLVRFKKNKVEDRVGA